MNKVIFIDYALGGNTENDTEEPKFDGKNVHPVVGNYRHDTFIMAEIFRGLNAIIKNKLI